MKRIVTSIVASLVLMTTLNAEDYGSVDGDAITKRDIATIIQKPQVDFEKLPFSKFRKAIKLIICIHPKDPNESSLIYIRLAS